MKNLQKEYAIKHIMYNFWSKVYASLLWILCFSSLFPVGLIIFFWSKKVPLRIMDHVVESFGVVLFIGLLAFLSREARKKAYDDMEELQTEINDSVGLT